MIISEVISKHTKLSEIPAGSYFLRDEHLFLKSHGYASYNLNIITFKINSTNMDRHDLHPNSLVKQVQIENIEYKLI